MFLIWNEEMKVISVTLWCCDLVGMDGKVHKRTVRHTLVAKLGTTRYQQKSVSLDLLVDVMYVKHSLLAFRIRAPGRKDVKDDVESYVVDNVLLSRKICTVNSPSYTPKGRKGL